MSDFVLEDRAGARVLLTKSTVGVFVRVAVEDGPGFTAELDPNQAAILHAKLGEMLGASAEEKFADRIDRLEMAIETLRKAFAEYAPQAALDALAEAFTAEMAKVKSDVAQLHRGGRDDQ